MTALPALCPARIETPAARERRLSARLAAAARILPLLAALAATVPFIGPWCRLTPDSFKYLSAARCLWETGAFPPERLIAPPGFPTLLAPLMALGDAPFLAIRILLSVSFVATVLLTQTILSRTMGPRAGSAAAWLTAVSAIMSTQSATLLSEIPYLPLALASLLFAVNWQSRGCAGAREAAVAGLLAGCAIAVRAMGVVLVPVLLACLVLSPHNVRRARVRHATIFLVAFALIPVAWHHRQGRYPAAYGYATQWTRARDCENSDATGAALQFERLRTFGPMRLADVGAAVVPPRLGWRLLHGENRSPAAWLIGLPIAAITLYRLARFRSAPDAYLVATLVMLALWPWDEGPRLIVPVLPFIWGCVAWLFGAILSALRRQPAMRVCLMTFAAALAAFHATEFIYTCRAMNRMDARETGIWNNAESLATHLDRETPAGTRLLAVIPSAHGDKVLLTAAAYLSRRDLCEWFEVGKTRCIPARAANCDLALVHSEIVRPPDELILGEKMADLPGFRMYALPGASAPTQP